MKKVEIISKEVLDTKYKNISAEKELKKQLLDLGLVKYKESSFILPDSVLSNFKAIFTVKVFSDHFIISHSQGEEKLTYSTFGYYKKSTLDCIEEYVKRELHSSEIKDKQEEKK